MNITNNLGNRIDITSFNFPAGEIGLKLNANDYKFPTGTSFLITENVTNSDALIRIAMAKDAVERLVGKDQPLDLFIPYFPYARQDRVCDKGEAFSLKVVADYINNLGFDNVIVADPHSLVTEALVDNIRVISQFDIFRKWEKLKVRVMNDLQFVSPDAGSNKKTSEIAGYFGHTEFIRADKLRDLTNGKIKEIKVYADDLQGRDVIIADDLCDGGATFIGLAKELRVLNCNKIVLYITHGIFSKGVEILLENGIDEIWTTNSFYSDSSFSGNIEVLDLNSFL
jgi:ribose-phosphate pyrophosphokinase